MKRYDIDSLNEEQKVALKQIEGPVLVTAGAGSGKTRLLTHRVAFLIDEYKVSPYNILAITFTNKAAGEMKERICRMVDGAEQVFISTFHSMCARILRQVISFMPPYTKNFTIYNESDSDKIIKNILESHNESDEKIKKQLAFHISNFKNGKDSLEKYTIHHKDEDNIKKISFYIKEYDEQLKKNNALDFDDLLKKTIEIFETYPAVLNEYANRFKYILVDEFQDTNVVQYELVKMLSSVHKNIFAVGDEDQCIYSWRGANFENIFNFRKDFPGAKIFKLERNYRSTAGILKIANNVIQNNRERLDKNMWTDKEEGEKPTLYNAYDEREEALYIAKTIEKLVAEGYNYKDVAVLMRMNALSRPIEEAFLSYNIPHRIFGGFKFYERVEIRNVLAYLRLFINSKDDIAFERAIFFPKRGIGESSIEKIKNINLERSMLENALSEEMTSESAVYKKIRNFVEDYNYLVNYGQNPLSKFVEEIVKRFKIREAYGMKTEEDLNRIMNIEQLISSVKEFEQLNPEASLDEFLESVTLKSDNDEIGEDGQVTIATVHAVKGLEFKVVFVIGLEEGIFPISRAMNSNRELEEERRLMYVALTRAEDKLFLTHTSKRYLYRESQYQTPSRFCKELGLVENRRSNQSGHAFSNISTENINYFNVRNFMQKKEEEKKPKKDVSQFKIGQKVYHPKFCDGEIVDISSDGLVADIVFAQFGKKSLMLELAPLEIRG